MNRILNIQELSNQLLSTDLHMHTIYCDGKNTPEEMVLSAIKKGFQCIGFSGHSYVSFDRSCGMNPANETAYRAEIARLQGKYQDQIRILRGIEQDFFSDSEPLDYDYVIGSVHYLQLSTEWIGGFADHSGVEQNIESECIPGSKQDAPGLLVHKSDAIEKYFVSVDDTPEILMQAVEQYYGGDYYLAAEQYFDTVSHVVEKTGADIIGHFDLFSKFNETKHLFDEEHPRYQTAWQKAADALITTGRYFEINTGAISRGWRSVPYPHPRMIRYIQDHGGRFLLSSDSHSKENIGYAFTAWQPKHNTFDY